MTEAAILLGQNDHRLIEKAMLANIQTLVDIAESVKDADFVMRQLPRLWTSRSRFQALDAAAPKHAILASNTSNMSFT